MADVALLLKLSISTNQYSNCSRMSMEFYSGYSHTPPGCVCSLLLHNVLTYLYMHMRNVIYNRC